MGLSNWALVHAAVFADIAVAASRFPLEPLVIEADAVAGISRAAYH